MRSPVYRNTVIGLIVLFLAAIFVEGRIRKATVYERGGKLVLQPNVLDKKGGLAYGTYENKMNETGWGVLNIVARASKPFNYTKAINAMYAAGIVEGYLTAGDIQLNYRNVKAAMLNFADHNATAMTRAMQFLRDQSAWAKQLVKRTTTNVPPFMRQLNYLLMQMEGLYEGFASGGGSPRNRDVVLFLNGVGDLIDILSAFKPPPKYEEMSSEERAAFVSLRGMCSGLIKLLPGYEDLYFSHSSWFAYAATMRIYKHYFFDLADPSTSATKLSFSSYPGFLESLDDFYLMNNHMAMIQTTNLVFNHTLYQLLTPRSVLAWQRVRIANTMARNGKEWAAVIGQYNSGTYNNQYMVIDLRKVRLNQYVADGALTIVEQIPGLVESSDQTKVLRTGYWPSYNVPFHERIYNISGYAEHVAKFGVRNSYQLAPRAEIFRRDANRVSTFDDMKKIMRYNDYKHDKYSNGSSCDTICCRGDLLRKNWRASGCYDTKVSSYSMAISMTADVISGPTLGNGLEPFCWNDVKFSNISHAGLPPLYNFGWFLMRSTLE